jgi:DNA-binding LacI/PurR family transcriptional regulator
MAAKIADQIADRHIRNVAKTLDFLPAERELAAEYGVARSTMRRALDMLENQGIVRSEQGRGRRILRLGEETNSMYRVAILQATTWREGLTSPALVAAIQQQCLKRKWQVLNITVENLDPDAVLRSLAEARVNAVALVVERVEIAQRLRAAGIYCIAVETAVRGLPIDQIYQDNYGACARAARYLIEKGHKRIGWIGPVAESLSGFERFSGARSILIEHHLDFRPDDIVARFPSEQDAYEYLSRADRPAAVMTMWHNETVAVLHAAARLAIKPGSLDLVGWGTEQHGAEIARLARASNVNLATMVWSVDEMAEVLASRIQLNRLEPGLHPLHIAIPSRLDIMGRRVLAGKRKAQN